MPHVVADRVMETTTTVGTIPFVLGGTLPGFRTFAAGIGDGNTTEYCATNDVDWEVGTGAFTAAGATLTRTPVASSNGGALVNFPAGTTKVFCDYSAAHAVFVAPTGKLNVDMGALVGTMAQFDTALTDGNFAYQAQKVNFGNSSLSGNNPADNPITITTGNGNAGLSAGGGGALLVYDQSGTMASLIQSGISLFHTSLALFTNLNAGLNGTYITTEVGGDRLALRNGANPQTFRAYNTYTDAANYERATLGWAGNVFNIGSENAGSGAVRDVNIIRGGVTEVNINDVNVYFHKNLLVNSGSGYTNVIVGGMYLEAIGNTLAYITVQTLILRDGSGPNIATVDINGINVTTGYIRVEGGPAAFKAHATSGGASLTNTTAGGGYAQLATYDSHTVLASSLLQFTNTSGVEFGRIGSTGLGVVGSIAASGVWPSVAVTPTSGASEFILFDSTSTVSIRLRGDLTASYIGSNLISFTDRNIGVEFARLSSAGFNVVTGTLSQGGVGVSLTGHTHSGTYQPADAQLDSLSTLAYAGNSLKVVRVNAAETGFELASAGGSSPTTMAGFDSALTDGDFVYQSQPATLDAVLINDASATAFVVGPNGLTNPTLAINNSIASAVTGVTINGGPAGTPPQITATSTAASEDLRLAGKGPSGRVVTISAGGTFLTGPVNLGIGTVTFSTVGAFTYTPANASANLSPTGTGTITMNPATAGTINNMSIGVSTGAAARFTTLITTGVVTFAQPAPTALSATATLTIAQLLTGIITSTAAAAVALTLPTGTLTDGGLTISTDFAFEWSVINLGSSAGAVTMTAGTNHTFVGNAVVAIGTSARFFTRKIATNSFTTYRVT